MRCTKVQEDSGYFRRWFALARLDLRDTPEVVQMANSLPDDFCEAVRYLRKTRHLTQEAMAERLFISTTTYREIENNQNKTLTDDNYISICIVLGIDYEVSLALLRKRRKTGILMDMVDNRAVAFRRVLCKKGKYNLIEVNEALMEIGEPPIMIERTK